MLAKQLFSAAVEFMPEQSDEYGFQCQMGMRSGKLIVE